VLERPWKKEIFRVRSGAYAFENRRPTTLDERGEREGRGWGERRKVSSKIRINGEGRGTIHSKNGWQAAGAVMKGCKSRIGGINDTGKKRLSPFPKTTSKKGKN